MNNTDLSKNEILKHITAKAAPELIIYKTVGSTNTKAKRMLADKKGAPFIVLSEAQTAGRGRLGRSFYSPEGSGLYMSIALSLNEPLKNALHLTSAAAAAVSLAIEKTSSVKTDIKWVNDIYLNGKKVAGILCEGSTNGGGSDIVIGIGINCTTSSFPAEIREIASAIGAANRNILAAEIYNSLFKYLTCDSWYEEYKLRSLVIGKEITYYINGEVHTAFAVDITRDGALEIYENGEKALLSSGEITVRI